MQQGKHADMQMQWSVTDPNIGARSVEEVIEKCKLGKQTRIATTANTNHCFLSYQFEQVVIDTPHLFLRILDKLTDLLIRDLMIHMP